MSERERERERDGERKRESEKERESIHLAPRFTARRARSTAFWSDR